MYYNSDKKQIGFKFTANSLEEGAKRLCTQGKENYGKVVNCGLFFKKYKDFNLPKGKNFELKTNEEIGIHFIQL